MDEREYSPVEGWHMSPIRFSSPDSDDEPLEASEWFDEELQEESSESSQSGEECESQVSPSFYRDDRSSQPTSEEMHNHNQTPTKLSAEPSLITIYEELRSETSAIGIVSAGNRAVNLDETPSIWAFKQEKKDIQTTQDLFVDQFAPWAAAEGSQQLQRFYQISRDTGQQTTYRSKMSLKKSGCSEAIAVISNRLSRAKQLQRKVYMLIDPRIYCSVVRSNCSGALLSNVVVIYIWEGGTPPDDVPHGNCKSDAPFVRQAARLLHAADKLLETQPPTTVARKLAVQGQDYIKRHQIVYRKTIRPELPRQKSGKTPAENFAQVSSIAREHGWRYWIHERPKQKIIGGDAVLVNDFFCLVLSPVACSMFAKQSPTEGSIENDLLETARVLNRSGDEITEFCQNRFESEGPHVGLLRRGVLFLDFTFKAANKQLGTISFLSNSFVRVNGGKPPLLDLGYVVLEKPDSSAMTFIGEQIASYFAEKHPSARCSALVTDREAALRCIIVKTRPFFGKTEHLFCSIHVKENFIANLGRTIGEGVHLRLFGVEGKEGLLNAATDEFHFSLEFHRIAMELEPGPKREWLMKQERQLFDGCSLPSRLKGGLAHQAVTTNLAENRNRFLKSVLGRRQPVQVLLEKLFINHEELLNMMFLSIFGNETEFRVREGRITFTKGKLLSLESRAALAKEYGLESIATSTATRDAFPSWCFDGRVGVSQLKFRQWVEAALFTRSSDDGTKFFCDDSGFSKKHGIPIVAYDSSSISCSCLSGQWLICPHLVAFAMYLTGAEKQSVHALLRARLDSENEHQRSRRLQTGNEGEKPYAKRRGSKRTANNYVRSIEKAKLKHKESGDLLPSNYAAGITSHDTNPTTATFRGSAHRQMSDGYRFPGGTSESQDSVSPSNLWVPVPSRLTALRRYQETHGLVNSRSQATASGIPPDILSSPGPPRHQPPRRYSVVSQAMPTSGSSEVQRSPGEQAALPTATQPTRTAFPASQLLASSPGPHQHLPHGYRAIRRNAPSESTPAVLRTAETAGVISQATGSGIPPDGSSPVPPHQQLPHGYSARVALPSANQRTLAGSHTGTDAN